MNVALRRTMSLQQFLAWEERQELRYEFDGFQPLAMTGGTAAHAAIQRNIIHALTGRLRGKPCQPFGSELKIEVDGRIRYPEAFVVCTPLTPTQTVVTDPVVVFEVLSDSTANTDLVEKNAEYRATPSIQRYVILEQTHAAGIVFVRKGEDWVSEIVAGDDAVLRLPEIGIEIPLTEIYADVELTGTPSDDDRAEPASDDPARAAPRA
jgi:Uma2 family endonuclease